MSEWIVQKTGKTTIMDSDTFSDGSPFDPTIITSKYSKEQYIIEYTKVDDFASVLKGTMKTLITDTVSGFKAIKGVKVQPNDATPAISALDLPGPTDTKETSGSWKPTQASIVFNDDGIAKSTLILAAFDKAWTLLSVDATNKFLEPSQSYVRQLIQDKKNGNI